MPLTDDQKIAINYRENTSFAYSREISKKFGELDCILSWCKSECRADWRWELIDVSNERRPGRYIFYFDGEQDFVAFLLQWA